MVIKSAGGLANRKSQIGDGKKLIGDCHPETGNSKAQTVDGELPMDKAARAGGKGSGDAATETGD